MDSTKKAEVLRDPPDTDNSRAQLTKGETAKGEDGSTSQGDRAARLPCKLPVPTLRCFEHVGTALRSPCSTASNTALCFPSSLGCSPTLR